MSTESRQRVCVCEWEREWQGDRAGSGVSYVCVTEGFSGERTRKHGAPSHHMRSFLNLYPTISFPSWQFCDLVVVVVSTFEMLTCAVEHNAAHGAASPRIRAPASSAPTRCHSQAGESLVRGTWLWSRVSVGSPAVWPWVVIYPFRVSLFIICNNEDNDI